MRIEGSVLRRVYGDPRRPVLVRHIDCPRAILAKECTVSSDELPAQVSLGLPSPVQPVAAVSAADERKGEGECGYELRRSLAQWTAALGPVQASCEPLVEAVEELGEAIGRRGSEGGLGGHDGSETVLDTTLWWRSSVRCEMQDAVQRRHRK